jgi:hypothetical protein
MLVPEITTRVSAIEANTLVAEMFPSESPLCFQFAERFGQIHIFRETSLSYRSHEKICPLFVPREQRMVA